MRFFHVIWKNVLQRKLRSALTSGGIALAVAAAVALISIAHGYVRSSEEYYRSRGVDIVVLRAGVAERLTSTLPEQFTDRLAEVHGIVEIDGSLTELVSFGHGDLVGIPLHGYRTTGMGISQFKIVEGRELNPDDRAGVLLGSSLATALNAKPGQKLDIEGTAFDVIGIFQPRNALEGNTAVTSLPELQNLMDRDSQVSEFHLRVGSEVASESEQRRLCRAIEALTDDENRPLGLKALPTRQFVSSSTESKLMTAMAYGTSLVAVGLSFIGILNTLWMSVLERTRDLGILRAIGWSRRRVMRLIFGESLVLAAGGVVLGNVMAYATVQGLSLHAAARVFVRPELDWGGVGAGVLLAITSTVMGAAYPAWRRASIPASEALRYE